MKGLLVAIVLALVVLASGPGGVNADTTPTDPQQAQLALIAQIRAQLGSNLADALAAQDQLRKSLQDNAVQQQELQAKIVEVEQKIAELDVKIADARRREVILTDRIDAERQQLRELARAIYTAPTSVLVVLGQAQSLSDLLTRIADLNVAGARARELKATLASDLTSLQDERKREQADRDEQVKQRDLLDSQLSQLRALQAQQEKSMADLQVKIEQTRTEMYLLSRQSTALAQQVTDMLQQQQDAIIAAAMQAVWTQVQLWSQSNNVGRSPPAPATPPNTDSSGPSPRRRSHNHSVRAPSGSSRLMAVTRISTPESTWSSPSARPCTQPTTVWWPWSAAPAAATATTW